jgi:hypothetical protein
MRLRRPHPEQTGGSWRARAVGLICCCKPVGADEYFRITASLELPQISSTESEPRTEGLLPCGALQFNRTEK